MTSARLRSSSPGQAGGARPARLPPATKRPIPKRRIALAPTITAVVCTVLLGLGWRARSEYLLVAESGAGYALGIVGLAMMTLLLLYSVRKHARLLRHAGPLQAWFHTHMALGLLGPTAILLHANFTLGSLNSTVALASMLLVAGSGVAGRFIYIRIHSEYMGRKDTLAELRSNAQAGHGELGAIMALAPELVQEITRVEEKLVEPRASLVANAWRFVSAGYVARRARRRAWRRLRPRLAEASPTLSAREARRALSDHARAVVRAVRFSGFERAFSIWHVLHLPLCVLLFGAAIAHVVAVHMY